MKFAALVCLSAHLLLAADPLAESARAKLALLKAEKAPPGSTTTITAQEWNAWARAEIADEPDIGLRDPKLTFGTGTVMFEVVADFGKLATRAKANGLFAKMLEGERAVKIAVRPETADGKVTVRLDLVEISGIPLSGGILKLVAELVISRLFDDVKIDEPFEIGHKIDHAVIDPAKVQIVVAGQPPSKPAAK
ncbi:MAG: hypothetical protein WDO18_22300 [Acidobacteriota bacterium]